MKKKPHNKILKKKLKKQYYKFCFKKKFSYTSTPPLFIYLFLNQTLENAHTLE